MGNILQYVGARYVPVFFKNADGSADWQEDTSYEPLTIVTYNYGSYTSRVQVPPGVGNPADNPDYWVQTGNFNAQLDQNTSEIQEILSKYFVAHADAQSMKADQSLKRGNFVRTFGYYSQGDGGGGSYIISDDTTGEGLLLQNGLYASLVLEADISVRQFGAYGDGDHDDTAAVQSALDAAISAGSRLHIPKGRYLLTSQVNVASGFNGVNIYGDNPSECVIVTAAPITAFAFSGGSGGVTGCKMVNVGFQGGSSGSTGISFDGTCGYTVEGCNFNGMEKAVWLQNSLDNFTEFIRLKDCDVRSADYCLYITRAPGATQMSYHGCGLEGVTMTGAKNVVYVGAGCQLYNTLLDFTYWGNDTVLVYLDASASFPVQTRQITGGGSIRAEGTGNQIFQTSLEGSIVWNGEMFALGSAQPGNVTQPLSFFQVGADGFISNNFNYKRNANTFKNGDIVLDSITPRCAIVMYHITAVNFEEAGYIYLGRLDAGTTSPATKNILAAYKVVDYDVQFRFDVVNLKVVLPDNLDSIAGEFSILSFR